MFNFLVKNPNISHAVIAVVMMAIIVPVLYFTGNPLFGISATALVGTYFYGRESGQNNHDMKNRGASEWTAFWQNIIPVGFTASNWAQFLVPSVIAGIIGFGAQYFLDTKIAPLAQFFMVLFKL